MAGTPVTNTTIHSELVDVLEDLDTEIRNVDPEMTPYYSNAQKGTANNPTLHEWLTDTYRAARNTPAPEGFDATFPAHVPRTRLSNVNQIAEDSAIVSDTTNAAGTATTMTEIVYQAVKKGVEIRRDVETVLVANVAKSSTDPRKLGSHATWMTNGAVGADDLLGVGGSLGVGDGSTVVTPGTSRAMTIGQVDTANQLVYTATGRIGTRMLMMSEDLKKKFSKLNFSGGGTDVAALEATATGPRPMFSIGAVNVYITDFGRIDLVPNVFMSDATQSLTGFAGDGTDHQAMLLDRRFYSVNTLPGRSFKTTPLAKTGSAEKWMVEWEGTLKVHNQKAHATIFGLDPAL